MTLLEATVYIVLVTAADKPMTCEKISKTLIFCTDGSSGSIQGDDKILINNKVTVEKAKSGELRFSNGLTGRFDSFGWVQFSNGIGTRRLSENEFAFTTQIACKPDPDKKEKIVRCVRYSTK